MGINLGLDLSNLLPNPRADRELNRQIYQQNADNAFRNTAFQRQEEWNWRLWNDRKFQVSNIVKDAARAGISPMAALGTGGAYPPNIRVPAGQGGRVAGTYQRKPSIGIQASAQIGAQTAAETARAAMYNSQADLYYWQARNFEDKWVTERYRRTIPGYGEYEDMEDLYIRVRDNTPEARGWKQSGYVPLANPDLNLEMPESIGAGYWAAPRIGVEPDSPQRVPYWGP